MSGCLFTSRDREEIQEEFERFLHRCPPLKGQELLDYCKELPEEEVTAFQFLYLSMPVSDLVTYSPELVHAYVRHALFLRRETIWGSRIPQDIFLNYVLSYRINNENIEDCRPAFYRELAPRIEGKSMAEAALEVNYWCLEKATYQSTDGRTASPFTTIRNAFGRCGEESTLTVAAMRSVGIPARQCYTPRWAHCDDNHAWVEIWAEGKWYYLGACEPEPILNKGWFTAAASKAMLVHSRVFSHRTGSEIVAERSPICSTVNNIATYGKHRTVQVRVTERGKPLPSIGVEFQLLNSGELFPIAKGVTDADGSLSFVTGLGDLYLHVHDGKRFLTAKLDVRQQDRLDLDFGKAVEFPPDGSQEEFEMNPPQERLPELESVSLQQQILHQERLKQATSVREAYEQTFFSLETARKEVASLFPTRTEEAAGYLVQARGNREELFKFYQIPHTVFSADDKLDLLSTLRPKDLTDLTCEVCVDALTAALPYREAFPQEIFCPYLLAPRVENEMLLPVRGFIQDFFRSNPVKTPQEIWAYIQKNLSQQDAYEYSNLTGDPRGILTYQLSTSHSNQLLFVTICRALGIPARLNPIDGRKEFWRDGAFWPVEKETLGEKTDDAVLTLRNAGAGKRELLYFTHLSVGRWEEGRFQSLQSPETILQDSFSLPVPAGRYRVLTAARQIDGSILARAYYLLLSPGEKRELSVSLRPDCTREKLKYAELPDFPLRGEKGEETSLFSCRQRPYGIATFLEPGKEPTEHLLNELLELKEAYQKENPDILLLLPAADRESRGNPKLQQVLRELPCQCLYWTEAESLQRYHLQMGVGDERLPFALVLDRQNRGLFAFANYNVGTARILLDIIQSDRIQ